MSIGSIEAIQLAGVDRVRQRISEIETKFGVSSVNGGDFQTLLDKEIQKSKAKSEVAPTEQVEKAAKVKQAKKTDKIEPVDKDVETFGEALDKATDEVKKTAEPVQRQTAQNYLPGEEALPDAMHKAINPFAAAAARTTDKVEGEEIDEPTRETKRYSNAVSSTEDMIKAAADKYNVDSRLVKAVAIAESNMNQNDISDAGAIGVMQLMPGTAAALGVDPYDKQQNIEGGAKYLRQMLDTFGGNVRKAVAAYNAGPGAVQKYGGIPPYSETQHYVGRVMDLYQ